MTLLSTLKIAGRAAVVASTLGVAALAAAPAQAAPPNFSFSFNFGNGGGPGMYFNYGGGPKKLCLSNRQIIWQLRNYGFRNVQIVRSRDVRVIVVAQWHGDWYQLRVNRCTGKIERRLPLKFKGPGGKGGFNITLSF